MDIVVRKSTTLKSRSEDEGMVFHYLTGPKRGQSFRLKKGERVDLGRSAECSIKLDDPKVSRRHAELVWYKDDVVVTDLKSQNGIIVNDNKVLQSALVAGDKLIIGQTIFRVAKQQAVQKAIKEDFPDSIGVSDKVSQKGVPIVAAIVVLLVVLLMLDNKEEKKGETAPSGVQRKYSSLDAGIVKKIEDKDRVENKELYKKTSVLLRRGLRELREENYYRALSEFNYILDLNPNDSQAKFYLRKTREQIDKEITKANIDAKREVASMKFQKATVYYCAILRLLYRSPDDQRYKDAAENIERIEKELGYEKGEINCVQKR